MRPGSAVGTTQRRWRTPSLVTASASGAAWVTASRAAPRRRQGRSRPASTIGLVFSPVARRSRSGPPWGRSASARGAGRRRPGRTARGAAGRGTPVACRSPRSGVGPAHLVDGDRGLAVLDEHVVGAPLGQRARRAAVGVVVRRSPGRQGAPIARRCAGHARGARGARAGLMMSYGGRQHGGEVDGGRVEPECAKGAQDGHARMVAMKRASGRRAPIPRRPALLPSGRIPHAS